MPKLFEDEENEKDSAELTINKDYAKNYDNWRKKEEINKFKTKYGLSGECPSESSDDDDDDDDDEMELDDGDEKDFLKTLACLKSKDPKIYQKDVKFFEHKNADNNKIKKEKKKKDEQLFLRDYERKILLETNGVLNNENESKVKKKPTYAEEQEMIKEDFKKVLEDDDDEGLLIPKEKLQKDIQKEETDYKEWLKGQEVKINPGEELELKPLRDYWCDPNLDKDEQFLRDYILNKKFLDKDSGEYEDEHYEIHSSDENLSEDDENLEKQEEFEHKYNFRYEEPDQEFIKRYPRTMENSLRKKDTKRSEKRAQLKKRKEEEKIRRRAEMKQLQALKRKEIQEKIDKLKEISGNENLKFEDLDLEGEFDPEEHERKMKELYNDDYYAQPAEEAKPEFPTIDEELDIEKHWDYYDLNENDDGENDKEPHCEDNDFNMDADYDPTKNTQSELIDNTKKRKRRRKSKFAEMIQKEKPKYDPSQYSNFQEYYDQYYSLDFEDMIGDLPCRMKYNKVVPNSYGLTVEEILMADDKELNRWYSLKKALKIKPDHVEYNEAKVFRERRANEKLMRKILPSLFRTSEKEEENKDKSEQSDVSNSTKKKNKSKNKKQTTEVDSHNASMQSTSKVESPKKKDVKMENGNNEIEEDNRKRKHDGETNTNEEPEVKKKKKKKKKKNKDLDNKNQDKAVQRKGNKVELKDSKRKSNKNKQYNSAIDNIGIETLKAFDINPKKFKNMIKYGKKKTNNL